MDSWRVNRPSPALAGRSSALAARQVAAKPVVPQAVPTHTPRKEALWEAVRQQKVCGYSNGSIARELRINRKTVRKYLVIDHPPTYAPRLGRDTKLTPYLPYLPQRWYEGCRNTRQLCGELVARG